MFCVRARGKRGPGVLLAAKYLKAGAGRAAARREAEILASLNSSSQVVSLVSVYRCQFYTVLVTEYLAGGDLFQRLSAPGYRY